MLGIEDTQITNAGLEYLSGLRELRRLERDGTELTDPGVDKSQRALPGCSIRR
jgi:hypothetical protein